MINNVGTADLPEAHFVQDTSITNFITDSGANPFAASTTLRVYTEQTEAVCVDVYNVRGQQVATLFNGAVAGERTVTLSSAALAPGVYFVRATGESFRSQQQVTVVR